MIFRLFAMITNKNPIHFNFELIIHRKIKWNRLMKCNKIKYK